MFVAFLMFTARSCSDLEAALFRTVPFALEPDLPREVDVTRSGTHDESARRRVRGNRCRALRGKRSHSETCQMLGNSIHAQQGRSWPAK